MPQLDLTAPAAEMGRAIAAGTLDPVELTEALLTEIKTTPEAQLIYARTTPDRARAEARAARVRANAGTRRSALDGVPISWKDLFDTAGTGTEAGTAMLQGRVPDSDAQVLANATAAGLVCLGKTHLTELAFSGLGVNPVTATPPNRHDPALAPGGSSSGAAASVAFGLAAAGIGSDTGGSVRVPAAWNDLVGFKTGVGSLPLAGVVPLCTRFDTVGPLTRTVEDAALIYAAMGGGKPVDLSGAGLSGARFLVLKNASVAPIEEAPQAAFEGAVARLSAAGAAIEEGSVPALEEAMPLSATVFAAEAYGTWGDLIEAKGDLMYPLIRRRFESGLSVSGPQFVADWRRLDALRAEWRAATAGYDAVLLPSCPILPPKVADLLADAELFTTRNLQTLRNTRVGNLMDLCGLTLPTGTPHCGLMALAPAGQERRILRLGAAMEKSLTAAGM
ncbi:amidase [Halovulum dunhuangense]|uniref:Amidase n=1 Tax=Halovulum dunhuangense TaxID=1505036 RepID=A0A849KWY6_9RHOB|nr:amidase family protein [Halovulum dunhuangense]NNU78877.1 amidase [Halovulum dunhuangense]